MSLLGKWVAEISSIAVTWEDRKNGLSGDVYGFNRLVAFWMKEIMREEAVNLLILQINHYKPVFIRIDLIDN